MTYRLSRFHSPHPLTKTIELRPNGELLKTAAGMSVDFVEVVEVGDIAALHARLAGAQQHEAFGLGVPKGAAVGERIPVTTKDRATGDVIARTKEHFSWPEFGVLVFDYDNKGESPVQVRDAAHCIELLAEIDPKIASAGWVCTRSTSSGIYRGDQELSPADGLHVYVLVKNARALPEYTDWLYMNAFLKFGHVFITRDGRILDRTIFDRSVFSPERLVFEADAIVGKGLTQRRPPPEMLDGDAIDATPQNGRKVTNALRQKFDKKRKELRCEHQAKADVIRAAYIDEEAEKLSNSSGLTIAQAKGVIAGRVRGELSPDDVLHFDNGDVVTVREVVNDQATFEHQTLRDPVEPELGTGKAKVYFNDGKLCINSFAHGGGRTYMVAEGATPVATISLTNALIDAQIDALDEACAAPELGVYQRGGRIVSIRTEAGAKLANEMNSSQLIVKTTRHIRFEKRDKHGELKGGSCPGDLARKFLDQDAWENVPQLKGIFSAPLMRDDGSITSGEGYDPETELFLDGPEVGVPEKPSNEQLKAALDALEKPFTDFPFVLDSADTHPLDSVSFSVILSAIFSALQRPMLQTVPAYGIDATAPGTGKSLLARMISIIATGHNAAAMPLSGNAEEDEKRITAALVEAEPVILIDNVSKPVKGDTLCAGLTEPTVKIRKFRENTSRVSVPNTALWLFTGNNLRFEGDLGRRALMCRLDAAVERPETRSDFAIVKPIDYVTKNRVKLLKAALTVMRAFRQAECPTSNKAPLGSFEQWSRYVRNMLLWLDYPDPVASQEYIRSQNPALQERAAVLQALKCIADKALARGDGEFRASEVVKVVSDESVVIRVPRSPESANTVGEAVGTLEEYFGKGAHNTRVLGVWLSQNQGQLSGGLKVVNAQGSKNGNLWAIVTTEG